MSATTLSPFMKILAVILLLLAAGFAWTFAGDLMNVHYTPARIAAFALYGASVWMLFAAIAALTQATIQFIKDHTDHA